jgi:hypothetical protein
MTARRRSEAELTGCRGHMAAPPMHLSKVQLA